MRYCAVYVGAYCVGGSLGVWKFNSSHEVCEESFSPRENYTNRHKICYHSGN
jgi:hypothetical protein